MFLGKEKQNKFRQEELCSIMFFATFRPAAAAREPRRFGLIDIVALAISQQPQIKFLERASERATASFALGRPDRLLREGRRPTTDREQEQEHPRDAVGCGGGGKRRPKRGSDIGGRLEAKEEARKKSVETQFS